MACLIVIVLTCFLTNLSQLPFFVVNGLSSKISTVSWVFCIMFVWLTREKTVPVLAFPVYGLTFLFLILMAVSSIMTGMEYWRSAHVYCLLISVLVFSVGTLEGPSIGEDEWFKMVASYVISSSIVALNIFISYFASGFDISSRLYAYGSKNSVSQILLTAVILLVFGISESYERKFKMIRLGLIVLLSLLILILKSRATIICFAVLYYAFLKSTEIGWKLKVLSFFALFIAVSAVFLVPSLYQLVIKDILLAGRDASNLNDLTSGRVDLIKSALETIYDNVVFGIGPYYLDCYPINVIMQFGIFPGLVLCAISLLPIVLSVMVHREEADQLKETINRTLMVLSVSYAINGFFEALTPLGPGAKCYCLWLVLGIAINLNKSAPATDGNV